MKGAAVMPRAVGRFAPSTTGRAHPGTLLAALLVWLDLRAQGGQIHLRLEDLDPERCKPEFGVGLRADLAWLGLDDWDSVVIQRERADAHAAALDILAAQGRLYPSPTSRSDLAAMGRRGPDGGFAYDNRDRDRPLPNGGWRAVRGEAVRCRLEAGIIALTDASGFDLSMDPAADFGDPVVVRRDGVASYHLVSVVDDAALGVNSVVRGRDLATATATQVALQRLLGLPTPRYRHHFLLLEPRGDKWAKFHGAVAVPELQHSYTGAEFCGLLAWISGLRDQPLPCIPADLTDNFSWDRIRTTDATTSWDGQRFQLHAGALEGGKHQDRGDG